MAFGYVNQLCYFRSYIYLDEVALFVLLLLWCTILSFNPMRGDAVLRLVLGLPHAFNQSN